MAIFRMTPYLKKLIQNISMRRVSQLRLYKEKYFSTIHLFTVLKTHALIIASTLTLVLTKPCNHVTRLRVTDLTIKKPGPNCLAPVLFNYKFDVATSLSAQTGIFRRCMLEAKYQLDPSYSYSSNTASM